MGQERTVGQNLQILDQSLQRERVRGTWSHYCSIENKKDFIITLILLCHFRSNLPSEGRSFLKRQKEALSKWRQVYNLFSWASVSRPWSNFPPNKMLYRLATLQDFVRKTSKKYFWKFSKSLLIKFYLSSNVLWRGQTFKCCFLQNYKCLINNVWLLGRGLACTYKNLWAKIASCCFDICPT